MRDTEKTPSHQKSQIVQHLNQNALARRWGVSMRTLERWRWQKVGPTYIKLGGRVAYRLIDIQAFEAANRHEWP